MTPMSLNTKALHGEKEKTRQASVLNEDAKTTKPKTVTSAASCVRPCRPGQALPPAQITSLNISSETSERQIHISQNKFDQLAIINNKINNNNNNPLAVPVVVYVRTALPGACVKWRACSWWCCCEMWYRLSFKMEEVGHQGCALSWAPPAPPLFPGCCVRWEALSRLSIGPQRGNQTNLGLNPSTVSQNKPVLLFSFLWGVYHMKKILTQLCTLQWPRQQCGPLLLLSDTFLETLASAGV